MLDGIAEPLYRYALFLELLLSRRLIDPHWNSRPPGCILSPVTIDRRTLLLASMSTLLPAGVLAAQDKPSPETFDYGPAKLDIYAPDGARNLPVVFFVHGGAWRFGKRSQVNAKPAFLLANGFCFVSINYRMLPQADVATQAGDVEKAYAYVRANIAQHGGDPNRIVGMGHSAGCHLIALTGMRGELPGVAGLLLDDTRAYDLAALAKNGGMVRAYSRVFSDPSQWAVLSPASYVDGRKHPPTFIAYSRADVAASSPRPLPSACAPAALM
ncbi:alpha/beta hydrolase [Mesorhizobium sp. B2-6-5]|uniref:alpha/beta hydrolase n=1 Tax=Mesorhizobium sp. B2-6-5 TaxID=2589912 RepID=UPI001FEF8281|nr:alpha/beta hydrolase [Mesorhizobium sp. B2-6-5]